MDTCGRNVLTSAVGANAAEGTIIRRNGAERRLLFLECRFPNCRVSVKNAEYLDTLWEIVLVTTVEDLWRGDKTVETT